MEITRDPQAEKEAVSYLKRVVVAFIGLTGISLSSSWVKKFLLEYHGPWWIRLGVLLLPWLMGGIYLWVYRRVWRPDELQEFIGRQALVIAFYGLLFGLTVLEQLQTAGLVPVFTWTNPRLVITMVVFMGIGSLWSKYRYR